MTDSTSRKESESSDFHKSGPRRFLDAGLPKPEVTFYCCLRVSTQSHPQALPKQEKSEKEEGVNRILLTEKTPPRSDFL